MTSQDAASTETIDDQVFFHYYDQHPTKEDLMGESAAQSTLIRYLLDVLSWLYAAEGWFVVSNLNIYRRRVRREYPLAPDVAVFKGVVVPDPAARTFRSWRLYEPDRPAPQVVFEVCSQTTWRSDLAEKPTGYAALGVQEYYAYDPNEPPYVPRRGGRLRGWQLVDGVLIEQQPDTQGRLWSAELASFLVPDGLLLRLTDARGQRHMTEGEAERAAKEAAWAKLRELGIDPDSL